MPTPEFTCCNGTYTRAPDGSWHYPWGDPVPGAVDLVVADAVELGVPPAAAATLLDGGHEILAHPPGDAGDATEQPAEAAPDRVVGMLAPELHVCLMLTVTDIAQLAGVSKATVDSYRYRGYLPKPQLVVSRTPLWSRPIVRHWLEHRPGSGWRTDVYGFRERMAPPRRLPISRARRFARPEDSMPTGS